MTIVNVTPIFCCVKNRMAGHTVYVNSICTGDGRYCVLSDSLLELFYELLTF